MHVSHDSQAIISQLDKMKFLRTFSSEEVTAEADDAAKRDLRLTRRDGRVNRDSNIVSYQRIRFFIDLFNT